MENRLPSIIIYSLLILLYTPTSCTEKARTEETQDMPKWEELIDKNLDKWDSYLSYKHKEGYEGDMPLDENGKALAPIGLNPEGYKVFQTIREKEETVIQVSGEYYGCLVSKEEYQNYHLQLQFKWGDKKWVPRKKLLKDSGVLYHSIGPLGAEHWRTWMLSQEFQIMEGHTGDYWNQATSAMDVRAYVPEYIMNPMAHESQDFLHIGEEGPYKNYCLRSSNFEKAHGEWNTLDLICFEDKSLHIVNGEVVMILKNSRYLDEEGEFQALTKGKIQLQSEAAEIFFKGIKIAQLNSMPEKYLAYF